MGTPHRGSSAASWTEFLARALHAAQLGTGTNTDLLSVLKKNSRTLSDITRQFIERGANLQIRTFYETEFLEYMNCLVCRRTSYAVYYCWLTLSFRSWTKIQHAYIFRMKNQPQSKQTTGRCANSLAKIVKSTDPYGGR